jgi:peptide/nickel transport system permease protein
LYDIPIIVGATIINAYMLALTVFILDFIYAMVDPRVKIGGN